MNSDEFQELVDIANLTAKKYSHKILRSIRRKHAEDTRIAKKARMASMSTLRESINPVHQNESAPLVSGVRMQHEIRLSPENNTGGRTQGTKMSNKSHGELVIKLVRLKETLNKKRTDENTTVVQLIRPRMRGIAIGKILAYNEIIGRLNRLIESELFDKPTGG